MPVDYPTPYPATPYQGKWYTPEEVRSIEQRATPLRVWIYRSPWEPEPTGPAWTEVLTCRGCGERFHRRHSEDQRTFCTRTCKYAAMRGAWSEEDIALLTDYYAAYHRGDPLMPRKELLTRLGRNEGSVASKARNLGLSRPRTKENAR